MRRRHLVPLLTYLVCLVALIWPALYNGYPILYSDTGTYVSSGMRLETPADRPITYGLFIRITSIGGFTLWTTIACQAAIVIRIIELILLRILPPPRSPWILILTVIALSGLSSLPWVVSQVMADIFTPIMLLSALLLFLPPPQPPPRHQRVLLYVLFFICVAAHLSHPVQVVVLLFVFLVLRWALGRWAAMRIPLRPIWIMGGLAVLAYPIMMSATAKSGNVLFMGAMVQHGVAKAYLDERCANADLKLCAWKDRLPEKAYQFHWDKDGPMGSYSGWPEANAEFGPIIRETLTVPKYMELQVRASLKAMVEQLKLFAIGDGWGPFKEGTDVYYVLSRHMRHDMWAMTSSRQYEVRMAAIADFIPIHATVVLISLIALVPLILLLLRTGRSDVLVLTFVSLAGTVLNAWGSGTFSGEVDRFGCKMIWLLPFLVICSIIAIASARKAKS